MKNNNELNLEIKQAVNEAEEAVIMAQSNPSPQFLQQADQKLMLASEYLQTIEIQDHSANNFLTKEINRAKEQLRNLHENQNALK